jgi:uncharacterized membrane protein YciS (DUF1049 family)
MNYKKSLETLFAQETKNEGKVAVALLAGIAIGGLISSLFSLKGILKVRKSNNKEARTINIKDSYTEMSNRLAN